MSISYQLCTLTPTVRLSVLRPWRWRPSIRPSCVMFWPLGTSGVGLGRVACQEFITQLGRNFQVVYEQANAHGSKVQTAGSNMASTDSAVSSSWA